MDAAPYSIVVNALMEMLKEVIDVVVVKEAEVQDRQGSGYSFRLRPHKTFDNKFDCAVLVLVDIDSQKRADQL